MNLVVRQPYLDKINQALKNVSVVILIGARQVGKTSIMKTHMNTIKKKYLFKNGQDPDFSVLFEKFSTISNYLSVNLDKDMSGILYIDEFQFIERISTMMKLLADTYPNLRIICSGSSSINILQTVEESLAGRVRTIDVSSLSFKEFLLFKDLALFDLISKYSIDTDFPVIDKKILIYLDEYLMFGGLPRVVLEDKFNEKIELLDDIYKTYLLRDVRSFIKNDDVVAFNKLLKLLASQIGCMVNPNEISNTLGISYRKAEEFLYLLEQMYIIRLVNPYNTNKRKEISKMKKLYFMDLGMRNLIYGSFNDINVRVDKGNIFENYVFLEIFKSIPSYQVIYYYRTLDGSEVDFVIDTKSKIIPVEVKASSLSKIKYYKALNSFMDLNVLDQGYVINQTLNDKSLIARESMVHYLPFVLTDKIFKKK